MSTAKSYPSDGEQKESLTPMRGRLGQPLLSYKHARQPFALQLVQVMPYAGR